MQTLKDLCSVLLPGRLIKTKYSEERCHVTQGGKSIQKFGKGNKSALNPTETDNVIDSRPGNSL